MSVILGIDPGSRITGYGIIRYDQNKITYLDSGCIRTTQDELSIRLLQIFQGICRLIKEFNPTTAAIEQIFVHQNPSSALKLGHARGAAIVAASSFEIPISEYSARQVKQSVVGYGNAQKDQVNLMVMNLLMLKNSPQVDAADALAVAICHSNNQSLSFARPPQRRRTKLARHWLKSTLSNLK